MSAVQHMRSMNILLQRFTLPRAQAGIIFYLNV
jgi:hypothetical protein